MSIYYKYAIDGSKNVVLSYADDFFYWYTSEALGNGLWILYERYSMWTSSDMHIGSCQTEFLRWRVVPFLRIRLDMLLLLFKNAWILPHLRQVQSFIRLNFHLIWYSQKIIHPTVMNKFRSWLGNSTFTADIALVHWFIYYLQEWTWVLQCTS